MPKLIEKPEDKTKRLLISNIEYECSIRDINPQRRCLIAQCSQPTYNRKRKDPGEFTVNELMRFAKRFNMPVGELFVEKTSRI